MRENVPVAPMTTLGVGGPARFFVDAEDEATALSALEWARTSGVEPTILGGGSNALVSDRGVDGLVLRVRMRGVREVSPGGVDAAKVVVEVGAGEALAPLVEGSARAGRAGIGGLAGMPAHVGATPVKNEWACGDETAARI